MAQHTLSVLGLALWATGCVDVREFEGTWTGKIVPEAAVLEGFADDVEAAPLRLHAIDLDRVDAELSTTDGQFEETVLTPVERFSNDSLASLTFDGSPLRSYLAFAPLFADLEVDDAGPAFVLISLFPDEHVELRIIRGNDRFGIFYLRRDED